jgi:hypothetical protein
MLFFDGRCPKVPNSAEQPGDGPSTPFSPGPTPPQPYKTQAFSSEPGPNAVVPHADRPTFPMVGDGLDKWCAQAELPSSIAICSDPELRALVIERQHAFDEARSRLSRDKRKALLVDQNGWVRSYPRICGLADAPPSLPLAPTIKDCMAQAGRARIAYLKAYGGTSPADTETGPARVAENSPPAQPETVSKKFRCRDPNTNFVYERSEPCARGDVTLSGPPSISNEQAAQSREPEQPTQNWQDWDASSGSSPAPNSLLAQWGRLNQQLDYVREHPPDAGYGGGGRCTYDPVVPRSQADAEWCRTKDQLEASLASLENRLKEQNWCRFQARTTWFPCNQVVNETEALAQFSEQDREFYAQQFIRAETVTVREMPGAPLSTVVKFSGGLLDPCRDPKVEGINCALTVRQRMDLLSQIVNYYNSLIPHYTLH